MAGYEYVRGKLIVEVDLREKEIRLVGEAGGELQCGFSMDAGMVYAVIDTLIYIIDKYFSDKPIGYKKPQHKNIEIKVIE